MLAVQCGDDSGDSGGRGFDCMDNAHPQDNNCVCDSGFDWCSDDPGSPDFEVCCRIQTGSCGDGTCNNSENSATCPGDCGTSNACVTSGAHEACAFDEFCYEDDCTGVFGRRWRVVLLEATVGTTKPDGSDWDAFGGAPDLFACASFNGGLISCSAAVQNSFDVRWNHSAEFTLQAGGVLEIALLDEDAAVNDGIMVLERTGDDEIADLVRRDSRVIVVTHPTDTRIGMTFELRPEF